jgi:hypothetical protein
LGWTAIFFQFFSKVTTLLMIKIKKEIPALHFFS